MCVCSLLYSANTLSYLPVTYSLYRTYLYVLTGQTKPRQICESESSKNLLRSQTFTPWASTILSLHRTCAEKHFELLKADNCSNFIPFTANYGEFDRLVDRYLAADSDKSSWYLHIGEITANLNGILPYGKIGNSASNNITKNKLDSTSNKSKTKKNGVEQLFLKMISKSSYTIRVFDSVMKRAISSTKKLTKVILLLLLLLLLLSLLYCYCDRYYYCYYYCCCYCYCYYCCHCDYYCYYCIVIVIVIIVVIVIAIVIIIVTVTIIVVATVIVIVTIIVVVIVIIIINITNIS